VSLEEMMLCAIETKESQYIVVTDNPGVSTCEHRGDKAHGTGRRNH